MSKQSGLGDNLYVGGYDLSGDVGSVQKISGSQAVFDVTGINKSGHERIGGLRDGGIDFTAFFNTALAAEHVALSPLPTADVLVTYARGTTLGNPGAACMAKQIDYPGTRAADGGFSFAVATQSDGYGLEWGVQLTAGLRTDTAATNGTSIDTTASASFGAQAYLQVTAFTGTDVTVKVQDSADNVTFADVTGLTFAQTTAAHTAQRVATSNTATIRRYLRAVTVTTGGFTSATFNVMINKNSVAGVVF